MSKLQRKMAANRRREELIESWLVLGVVSVHAYIAFLFFCK